MNRAYRTTLMGVVSIVAAKSPAQAKARSLKQAVDAHYYSAKFVDVRCHRAPEHDAWAEIDESHICWGEPYLPKLAAEAGAK